MFVLRVVAANASYLVTSLLIKEVYLTKRESEIDKKWATGSEEGKKKGHSGSATGSSPSGSQSPSNEGVVTQPPHTLPPDSLDLSAPVQNDSDSLMLPYNIPANAQS